MKNTPIIDPNSDLDRMGPDELEAVIKECLDLTEEKILRAAKATVRLITVYGKNPKLEWRRWLQNIGSGLLHEKVFIKFLHNKPLLEKLKAFPRQEQLEYATGERRIPLAYIINDGIQDTSKQLEDMSQNEINLALSTEGIRPLSEQKERLKKGPLKKLLKAKNISFSFDPLSLCFKHGNKFIRDAFGNKIKVDVFEKAYTELHQLPFPLQECTSKYAETYRT